MELVDKVGGFGIVEANKKERALLDRLVELADYQYKYTLGVSGHKETTECLAIMGDLFPKVHLEEPTSYGSGKVHFSNYPSTYFQAFAPYLSLNVELPYLPERSEGDRKRCQLSVLFPTNFKENNYPVTISIIDSYSPNVDDDIVKILGAKEKPVIEGPASLTNIGDYFGFAEVPHFDNVQLLYKKTKHLIQNSKGLIGVAENDLRILRRDSIWNDNLVIRDLSKQRYDQELQRLITF